MADHDSSKKIEEIEYLRAVAVIITVFAHSRLLFLWNPEWLKTINAHFVFGTGVDLFFCISGFVISKTLVEMLDNARADEKLLVLKAFWVRRFHRLMPSAWFWAMWYVIASGTGVFSHNELGSFWLNVKNFVAVSTFTANMRDQSNLMAIYWTLSSEEQFYLVYPIFLLFVAGTHRKWALLAIAGALFLSPPTFRLLALRFDTMIWGVLLFFFSRTVAYRVFEPTWLQNRALSIVTALFLVFLLVAVPTTLGDIYFMPQILTIVCALLVWIASYGKSYLLALPQPFSAGMSWAGARSYAIYLVHGPALYITHDIWYRYAAQRGVKPEQIDASYTLAYTLTFVALIVLLCEFNYRVLEVPFIARGRRIAKEILAPLRASGARDGTVGGEATAAASTGLTKTGVGSASGGTQLPVPAAP
ncbi:MAG: acyltransferase family protein [Phycisphaerae bacterium]